MSKDVIVLKNNINAVRGVITGAALKSAVMAGGGVLQNYAKINVEKTFSGKSTGAAGLGESIKTIVSTSTETKAEVDVGPTVIYGAIREFGGMILPVHAKMLSWLLGSGSSGKKKQKALGRVFVSDGRVFAEAVQVFPTPYLRPAFDEHKDQIVDAMMYQIKKAIAQAAI